MVALGVAIVAPIKLGVTSMAGAEAASGVDGGASAFTDSVDPPVLGVAEVSDDV